MHSEINDEYVIFCKRKFRGLRRNSLLNPSIDFEFILPVNADLLVIAEENPRFARLIDNNYSTFDGQVVWFLARLLPNPRRIEFEKISGSDFGYELLAYAAKNNHRVFMLGASPAVNALVVSKAFNEYGVLVDGFSPPIFSYPASASINSEIMRRVRDFKPAILFVAFGAPKQEFWIDDNRDDLKKAGVKIVIACGGTLDFMAGSIKRAPPWVQRSGLEGVYRLYKNPSILRVRRLLRSFVGIYYGLIYSYRSYFIAK